MVSWAGLMLAVLKFSDSADDESFQTSMTTTMLAGLAPAMLLAALASYLRLRLSTARALAAFR
jgi:uncharacterized protein YigA (DUF484 family)